MDDAKWKQLTKVFPRLLQGAGFEALAARASTKQPPFICAAFSPDETQLALSGGGRIPCRASIWVARVPTLETVTMMHGHHGIHALAWDTTTGLLASASNDYTVALWDVARHDHLFVSGGSDDAPIVKGNVAFAGDALYVGETEAFEDNVASLLRVSLQTGEVESIYELGPGLAVSALAVEASGQRWAIVRDHGHYFNDPWLVVGSGSNGKIEESKLERGSFALRWCDGRLLCIRISDDEEDNVEVHWDGQKRRIEAQDRFGFSVSNDGRFLAFVNRDSKRVTAISIADGREAWRVELPSEPRTIFWSRSDRLIAIAGAELIAIVDTNRGELTNTIVPPAWFRSGRM